MKRISVIILIVLLSTEVYTQISLEHTYNFSTITSSSQSRYLGLYKFSVGSKYAYVDNNFLSLYLYNINHTIYKTINIQKPLGFSSVIAVDVYNVSDKLFNLDNKIEYMIIYRVSGDSINPSIQRNIVYIYDEDGSIQFFKEYSYVSVSLNGQYGSYIQDTPNGTKMILTNQNSNFNVTGISVYSLPGNLVTAVEKDKTVPEKKSFLSNPFPNPANEYAAVFYKLPELKKQGSIVIYDINGKQVQNINVDGSNEYILFNNINLSNGSYFYSLIVDNEIVESRKMMISR